MTAVTQPTVLIGCSNLAGWLARERSDATILLVDAAIVDSPFISSVREAVAGTGCATSVEALTGPATLTRLKALSSQLSETDTVVGVGGGTVLDQAKLVSVLCADPTVALLLSHRQRTGWIPLSGRARAARTVAIPTTVGTGTELSPVACLDDGTGKRLVGGECLLPDAAVLDPEATRTLPPSLLVEGAFEVISRIIGPYAGSHDDLPIEDGLAETTAARLAIVGHQIRERVAAGEPVGDQARFELARISGFSHSHWLTLGRQPFGYKAWFLATELSYLAGCRKVPALVSVLPPVWRRVLAGETALGSARRLRRIWCRIAATAPDQLPADPVAGVQALARWWGLSRAAGFDPGEVARRTVRRWGAGLPMLAGVSPPLLAGIVAECDPDGGDLSRNGVPLLDDLAVS